jgi:hypothetical protein
MKSIILRLLIACVWLGGSAVFAGEAKGDPYRQAVQAYVVAAGQQLSAIRGEIDAATKDGTDAVKQKYAAVYTELDRTDKSLEILKTADAKDFDRLKADFESTRDAMIKLLEKVRSGR